MPKLRAENTLADATLRLLPGKKWQDLTLASVIRAAKLSWTDAFALAPSKSALVTLVLRRIAEETARRYTPDRASRGARERVFDAAMAWFDVQQSHKDAMHTLYNGLRRDPLALLSARRDIFETADRILALAEADCGPAEAVRRAAVSGVLARATLVWLADDDEMGKTMAQLDRDLRRVERLFRAPKPKSVPAKKTTKSRRH
jgi:hypothetical protein